MLSLEALGALAELMKTKPEEAAEKIKTLSPADAFHVGRMAMQTLGPKPMADMVVALEKAEAKVSDRGRPMLTVGGIEFECIYDPRRDDNSLPFMFQDCLADLQSEGANGMKVKVGTVGAGVGGSPFVMLYDPRFDKHEGGTGMFCYVAKQIPFWKAVEAAHEAINGPIPDPKDWPARAQKELERK